MAAPEYGFSSTDHLGSEAVAAFVDGELAPIAARRAKRHLLACRECRDAVAQQRQAARRLRDSGELRIPAELRRRLAALSEEQFDDDAPTARNLSHRRPESLSAFVEGVWRHLRKTADEIADGRTERPERTERPDLAARDGGDRDDEMRGTVR